MRTIIVILTRVEEIVAHQELSAAVTGVHAWQARTWKVPALWATVLSLLSSPYLLPSAPATHTHTELFLHPSHNSMLQQLSPSATSVPCPLREDDVFDGRNHRTVYLLCLLGSLGAGAALSEWHVCTARCLQKRFNVADMLFCLLLCVSLLIRPMNKQNVPPQSHYG